MSDASQAQDEWAEMVERMNDAVADSIEENLETQAAMVESWADAVEGSFPSEEDLSEGLDGYNRAHEEWMDATERIVQRTGDAARGEDVDPEEFRDIWLQSANEAFKHVMGTSAFAAANGQLVETMMELRQEADDVTQETIAQLGFPTREEIDEVGKRLIELERRQQDVENKLDEILTHLEED